MTAALVAASACVLYLIVREGALHPPFPQQEFGVFLSLWQPMVMIAAALALVFGAPLALLGVILMKRANWPRPLADLTLGAFGGVMVLGLALAVFNRLFSFGT
jgi:RsiW-degrading membrane proteinase PrsW (M82 family)